MVKYLRVLIKFIMANNEMEDKNMTENKQKKSNSASFTLADIAKEAENSAVSCYGVIDLSHDDSLKNEIRELLKKENTSGAIVRQKKNVLEIDLYITVSYGVRITEVALEVQKKVKFDLEKKFHLSFNAINVYVQSVRAL